MKPKPRRNEHGVFVCAEARCPRYRDNDDEFTPTWGCQRDMNKKVLFPVCNGDLCIPQRLLDFAVESLPLPTANCQLPTAKVRQFRQQVYEVLVLDDPGWQPAKVLETAKKISDMAAKAFLTPEVEKDPTK